jgi:hypothetical protein
MVEVVFVRKLLHATVLLIFPNILHGQSKDTSNTVEKKNSRSKIYSSTNIECWACKISHIFFIPKFFDRLINE